MFDQTLLYCSKIFALFLTFTASAAGCAFTAHKFGDTTPKADGRLTLNPLVHLDPIGSILLPGLLMFANVPFIIGYPKPLDLRENLLRPRKLGAFMVAFSGPGANIFLAWFSLILLHINGQAQTFGNDLLMDLIWLNLGFATFGLLPLYPMPGGKMIHSFLPYRWANEYEKMAPYTSPIIVGLMILSSVINVPILFFVLQPIFKFLYTLVSALSGH